MKIFGSEFVEFSPVEVREFSKFALKNAQFVRVKNKREAVFANANCVKFIVCDNIALARALQSVAEDYLFDSKIALLIENDAELDDAIDARIDAVIFKHAARINLANS